MIVEKRDSEVDLSLVNGIKEITYEKIRNKVLENFAIGDILALLIPMGISLNKIKKLLGSENNVEILKKKLTDNPYVLTGISGISFTVADKIAMGLNPDLKVSEERLLAFVKYYLYEVGESKGHTWLNKNDVKDEVIKNVGECEIFLDNVFENSDILISDGERIGLKVNYDSELFIWNKIKEITDSEPLYVTENAIEEGIREAELEQGFDYTEEQRNKIINMTKSNFVLLGGRAGVGKSVTARGILKIYEKMGYSIFTSAFSAKASVRAQEATGRNGSTLHRLLGLGYGSSESTTIEYDVLFVDEAGLNPLYLMRKLFDSIQVGHTKIILSGDDRQLPSLGLGNVFSDLLRKKNININILTEIQRQAAESGIIVDANIIRDGVSPISNYSGKIVRGNKNDLFYIFKEDPEELFRIAVSSFLKSVQEKGIENVVLLAPFRKKVLNSTHNFNKVIQKELNSVNEKNAFVHGDKSFWLNDHVIHCVNNYEKNIFNGFTGMVSKVSKDGISVDFNGNIVDYTREDINELDLAYCLTPFKFQGSECFDAIIVIDNSHYVLLSAQYLYTSLTRAKERALVLSTEFAFKKCMKEDKTIRNTFLKEFE
jgi:exodeoxyribonuclease V alpha subunit